MDVKWKKGSRKDAKEQSVLRCEADKNRGIYGRS